MVQSPESYVDLALHRFMKRLLDVVHPVQRGGIAGAGEAGAGEAGTGAALRAAKWRHLVETDRVPPVLRVSTALLVTAQPQVLPVASQICR